MSEEKTPVVYEVGAIVVNSSGTFAKVLQVKFGVHICTDWFDEMSAAQKAKDIGLVRFNESARVICGIKLASEGGDAGKDSTDDVAKTEADAKAKEEVEAEIKAQEELNSGAEKSEYKVLRGVEFPRGTVHKEESIIELTDAAAESFAEGIIEKVEVATDETKTEGDKPKGMMSRVLGK